MKVDRSITFAQFVKFRSAYSANAERCKQRNVVVKVGACTHGHDVALLDTLFLHPKCASYGLFLHFPVSALLSRAGFYLERETDS